jgi:hypothetical protein
MTASDMREPRRYWTFVVILAFHLALIMALMRFSKTLPFSTPIGDPLELIHTPAAITPRTRPPFVLQDSLHVDTKVTPITPSSITIPQTAAPNESVESPIDWAGEAQKAGAAKTPSPEVRSFDHRFPSESERPPKSVFDEPPERHAGEQFRTDDGRWVVYVSVTCYQIYDPLVSISALANGISVQTYCKGKSKTPSGDLFDQLPAYKRNRPGP